MHRLDADADADEAAVETFFAMPDAVLADIIDTAVEVRNDLLAWAYGEMVACGEPARLFVFRWPPGFTEATWLFNLGPGHS